MGEPLRQRSASVTKNQASFRLLHQGQRRDHQLAIGEKQRDWIRLPHDRMERPIQHEVAEEVVISNSDLLIGAVFLIDRRL